MKLTFSGNAIRAKEGEFAQNLLDLSQKEFDLVSFEETIDKIRTFVAEVRLNGFAM